MTTTSVRPIFLWASALLASGDVGINVVSATFSADPSRLEHLVRADLLSQPDWRAESTAGLLLSGKTE